MRWWEQLDGPVLGRYRIERLLGEGGMARVFLATDLRADRPVAFKTPKIESFPPESVNELLGRFNREFRSQASDPIQGVIPIYESGDFTDGAGVVRPFLAMQYLSGGSLGDLLGGAIGQRTHRQTLAEVLDWLVPIARTVDRLHARKYLHRDIKPDNILFNSDGDPFLADLGIVGSLDNTLAGSTMASTALGVLGSPGSPGYQSPESIQADPVLRNVTASDQFSLAVTVYEALAGRLPVAAGTNQEWYGALMHWSPTALSTHCPDMPPAASDAVMKAMSTQAAGRFTTCSEFAKAVAAAVQAPRAVAVAAAAPAPMHSPPRAAEAAVARAPIAAPRAALSTPAKAGLAAAILAVAVLAVGGSQGWFGAGPEPDGRDTVAGLASTPEAQAPGDTAAADHAPAGGAANASGADPDPDPDEGQISAGVDNAPKAQSPSESASVVPAPVGDAAKAPAWTVGFGFDKTNVSIEARPILDDAVAFLRRRPDTHLLITGHADPTEGSAAAAMGMSARRAEGVREYLVGNGIDGARLRVESRGGTQPLGRSVRADGSSDLAAVSRNRRVQLQPVPGLASTVGAPAAAAPPVATAKPVPAGPLTFALAKARGVQCQDFDFDHDSVADCWDKCQAVLKPTDYVNDVGCPRPFSSTFRVVAFGAGQARLDAASRATLDAAVRDLVKDNRLKLKLLGRADSSEGTRGQNRALSERRAKAAFDYLTSRGVPGVRLEVVAEGDLASVGSARHPSVIATQRIVVVHGERGAEQPIPIVPLEASQVPKPLAIAPVVARWTFCRADGVKPDDKTLMYSLSAAMDVAPIADWQERLKSDRPYEPALRNTGVVKLSLAEVNISCSPFKPTVAEAIAAKDRMMSKYLVQQATDFESVHAAPGNWSIRGALAPTQTP